MHEQVVSYGIFGNGGQDKRGDNKNEQISIVIIIFFCKCSICCRFQFLSLPSEEFEALRSSSRFGMPGHHQLRWSPSPLYSVTFILSNCLEGVGAQEFWSIEDVTREGVLEFLGMLV